MLIQQILYDHDTSPRPAVVCADKGLACSYAELSRMSRDLAAGFLDNGLRAGDRVAILLPNSIEFVAAFFGTITAGAVAAPLDIYLKRDVLLTVLGTIRPRILVTNHHLLRKIRTELQGTTVCLAEYDGAMSPSFTEYGGPGTDAGPSGGGDVPSHERRFPLTDPAGDALIILSSGTTGVPKGVRLSHRAVLRNIAMHLESLELEDEVRGLQVLPMNFSYGLIASFLSILRTGGTAVLLPFLEPKPLFEAIARHDINLFMGTPTIFQYLIDHSGPGLDLAALPLRCITLGGDRCRCYTLDLIRDRFPSARIHITYGLSEAGPRVSTLRHDLIGDIPHSVGLPLKGVEVTILDNNGRRCAPLEPGEIVVKTPSLMNGYFGDDERTNRVIRNGLCHTGDVGYLDERGFLYYVGRNDRQFKFGGRYVNPAFIEQCIASHPQVREVSVAKIEDEREEVIRARIKAGDAREEEELVRELKRICRQHMPAYMVPGEFIFEEHDHYIYKGKRFVPAKKQLPA